MSRQSASASLSTSCLSDTLPRRQSDQCNSDTTRRRAFSGQSTMISFPSQSSKFRNCSSDVHRDFKKTIARRSLSECATAYGVHFCLWVQRLATPTSSAQLSEVIRQPNCAAKWHTVPSSQRLPDKHTPRRDVSAAHPLVALAGRV